MFQLAWVMTKFVELIFFQDLIRLADAIGLEQQGPKDGAFEI
jgi:hypothetical protein